MATLAGNSIASSYTSLLKLDGNTDSTVAGNNSNAIQVKTGDNDATPLFLNTDRLGIGGQPSVKLQVEESTNGADVQINMRSLNDGGAGRTTAIKFDPDARKMHFGEDFTNLVLDTSNVRVGIGCDHPSVPLEVELSGDTGTYFEGGGSGHGASDARHLTITASTTTNAGDTHTLNSESATGVLKLATTGTDRMVLDANSRISLSNNDSGGTGGRDSTSANTTLGYNAGTNIASGSVVNTFIGHASGSGSLDTAQNNTAVGAETLQGLTTGDSNTVMGAYSGFNLTTGSLNTFIGTDSGFSATTQSDLVLIGRAAGDAINDDGANGTVAVGESSLTALTSGQRNTAVGFESLKSNTIGDKNTAVGYQALESYNADADAEGHNTAVGHNAMQGNVTGTDNTAIGNSSAFTGTNNMTAGDDNTFIGSLTSPSSATPTNQTVIGKGATGQADNSVTLGNADVTDVYMAQDSGATVHADYVLSQGNQNHVANTMSSPYYRFDGVDDKIEVADNAILDFATNDFSVEALVRIPSGVADRTILGKIDMTNSANEGYAMEVGSNGKLTGRITGNNTRVLISEGSTVIADGNYHHVCITFDRSANATVYVNGVAEGTTDISGSSGDASNSNPFQIGTNDQEANFTEMEISHARVFNNLLTATEVKELYSGASVPFKYKGANQTDLVTSNFVNNGSFAFDTFTGASANGFTAVASTSGTKVCSTADEIVLEKGKSYRVSFDVTLTSGAFPVTRIRESALSGTVLTIVERGTVSNGDKINFEFTSTVSGTHVVQCEAISDVNFAIANFNFVQIGAVAEYDGSSAGEKVWGDKSGNSLDGTVSGATVENAPYDAGTEYEEGEHTTALGCSTSGSITVNTGENTLAYIKIGNQVTVTGTVSTSAVSSPQGHITMTLPYTIGNGTHLAKRVAGSIIIYNHNSGTNISDYVMLGVEGDSFVKIYLGDSHELQEDSAQTIDASSVFAVGITYFT